MAAHTSRGAQRLVDAEKEKEDLPVLTDAMLRVHSVLLKTGTGSGIVGNPSDAACRKIIVTVLA